MTHKWKHLTLQLILKCITRSIRNLSFSLNQKMIALICMSDIDFCYKSCGDYIVTMKKLPDTMTNESRKGIVDPLHAKFRADKLFVINIKHKKTDETINRIQNTTFKDNQVWYEVSKEVSAPDYCENLDIVCAPGIHYFLSRKAAYYWECARDRDINGPYHAWYESGQPYMLHTYLAGKLHGPYQIWYSNGQLKLDCTYVDGELDGPQKLWYDNGKPESEGAHISGEWHGLYRMWYEDGQQVLECTYVAGKLHGPYQSWYRTGEKKLECTYLNGIIDGLYRHWYHDTGEHYQCIYRDGQKYEESYGNI